MFEKSKHSITIQSKKLWMVYIKRKTVKKLMFLIPLKRLYGINFKKTSKKLYYKLSSCRKSQKNLLAMQKVHRLVKH